LISILINTNCLIRLSDPAHSDHSVISNAVSTLQPTNTLVIVPQVLYEFWVVATKPTNSPRPGLGLSHDEARALVTRFTEFFRLLRDERRVFENWIQLVYDYKVSGRAGHDARLVAAMQRHDIDRILTFNPSDFVRYPEISVATPSQILTQSAPTAPSTYIR